MKITFACIVFNGDYVLRELIENIYPFAHKIIFVDGVVDYWAEKGFSGSTDNTVKIIESFPDLDRKIVLHKGIVRKEKTELCQVFMPDVPADTDYLWCPDSDEVFKKDDIRKTIQVLSAEKPHSVSFQSNTFFGGFEYILDGFERNHNFKRILKYEPGCTYVTHRPPTLSTEQDVEAPIHLSGKYMADKHGVEMYHYSYVFPKQVHSKIQYYKDFVAKKNCIDGYFEKIWLPWVNGNAAERDSVEAAYDGVHEFLPSYRGACRTMPFTGMHPFVIQKNMDQLKKRFEHELRLF